MHLFKIFMKIKRDKEKTFIISDPKNFTSELAALVDNLEYCTMYLFAVSAGSENKINPNNVRGIVTEINRELAPENLQVDFEPGQEPCLLIKWSASCANIGEPIGYTASIIRELVLAVHDHPNQSTYLFLVGL